MMVLTEYTKQSRTFGKTSFDADFALDQADDAVRHSGKVFRRLTKLMDSNTNECGLSGKQLAMKCGISQAQVYKCIAALEDVNLIHRVTVNGKAGSYIKVNPFAYTVIPMIKIDWSTVNYETGELFSTTEGGHLQKIPDNRYVRLCMDWLRLTDGKSINTKAIREEIKMVLDGMGTLPVYKKQKAEENIR